MCLMHMLYEYFSVTPNNAEQLRLERQERAHDGTTRKKRAITSHRETKLLSEENHTPLYA